MNTPTAFPMWSDIAGIVDEEALGSLEQALHGTFSEFFKTERIDSELLPLFIQTYIPIAAWIAKQHTGSPIVIGINGAQGSGKSTLSKLMSLLLDRGFNKSTLNLSIDDLYLSREERKTLATDIHPLLEVRGVPGTHDVARGIQIITSLKDKQTELPILVPVFDKAQDDLLPESQWRRINSPADIILFEGWCVGAQAQSTEALAEPINELEDKEDPSGEWRSYVNDQLQGPYKKLFTLIDRLVMLKVPDMASVFEWRSLQEEKLRLSTTNEKGAASKIMSPKQVSRFIMFYERLTRLCLEEMPHSANVVLELNKAHQVDKIRMNE